MLRDARIAAGLEIEAVTSPVALGGLADDWGDLWARCPDATPFQSPEWLLPWWHAFGNGELFVRAFRRRNRLVGIVPLYIGASDDGSGRIVRLLGSGNSDYLDAVIESGREEAVVALLFRDLERHRDRWDGCDFLELRPGSALLRAPAPAGWDDEVVADSTCPLLQIDPRDPDAAVPSAFLEKLRYYRRSAERHGAIHFELADDDSFDEAFDALLRLHGARWAERGQAGLVAEPAVQSFNRVAARGLLRRGVLRLYTLYVDEQAAASCYTFLRGERAYLYLTGFDPGFRKLSPGHLLLHHAIRESGRQGARLFDMLRGQEAYKSRWNAADRTNRRRRLRHRVPVHERRDAGRTQARQAQP